MCSSPYPKRTCFFARWERHESWDINKTVQYLLENFTNCECDSWNFLSSCLHDLRLSAWVVLMKHCHCWSTSENISKYSKKTRRTRFNSEKVSNLTFHDWIHSRRHAMFSDLDVSSKMGLKPEKYHKSRRLTTVNRISTAIGCNVLLKNTIRYPCSTWKQPMKICL